MFMVQVLPVNLSVSAFEWMFHTIALQIFYIAIDVFFVCFNVFGFCFGFRFIAML